MRNTWLSIDDSVSLCQRITLVEIFCWCEVGSCWRVSCSAANHLRLQTWLFWMGRMSILRSWNLICWREELRLNLLEKTKRNLQKNLKVNRVINLHQKCGYWYWIDEISHRYLFTPHYYLLCGGQQGGLVIAQERIKVRYPTCHRSLPSFFWVLNQRLLAHNHIFVNKNLIIE